MKKIKEIIIVGAGSAGWITALFLNKKFPECNISVIGSTEVGILGAGEGTTPKFLEFLKKIDVSYIDIIRNCKGTIKNGIKFDNWNNDGSYYYNNFEFKNDEYQNFLLGAVTNPDSKYHKLSKLTFNKKTEQNKFVALQNIIDLSSYLDKNSVECLLYDDLCNQFKVPILQENYSAINAFALHFDAILLAEYFKKIGIKRGIKYFDEYIEKFEILENGSINQIVTKTSKHKCDFVFDCSGFKRLIIGKLYDTKWKNVKEKLPVNKAIPFFTKPDKKVECYTTATAMKYGWSWKIPLQHRNGCGYVFDSSLCDEESAIEEVRTQFGDVQLGNRCFSFDAGYYEKTWVNNCIAIGLSAGFLEPLEASSIHTSISVLEFLSKHLDVLVQANHENKYYDNRYNKKINLEWEGGINFLRFHYLTSRNDTKFWEQFKINSNDPLKSNLFLEQQISIDMMNKKYINNTSFVGPRGMIRVGLGINLFNKESIKQILAKTNYFRSFSEYKELLQKYNQKISNSCITHNNLLNNLIV